MKTITIKLPEEAKELEGFIRKNNYLIKKTGLNISYTCIIYTI